MTVCAGSRLEMRLRQMEGFIHGEVRGGAIHHRLEVGPGEINFRSLQVLACCLCDARDYDFPHRPVTPVCHYNRICLLFYCSLTLLIILFRYQFHSLLPVDVFEKAAQGQNNTARARLRHMSM